MKNWKTTLAGLLTGLPTVIEALLDAYNRGFFTGQKGIQLLTGIGFIVLGVYCKDKNVTGGTVANIPSDKDVVKETTKKDIE